MIRCDSGHSRRDSLHSPHGLRARTSSSSRRAVLPPGPVLQLQPGWLQRRRAGGRVGLHQEDRHRLRHASPSARVLSFCWHPLSPSLLRHLPKGEGGAQQNDRTLAGETRQAAEVLRHRHRPGPVCRRLHLCAKCLTLEPGGVTIFNSIALIHPARVAFRPQAPSSPCPTATTTARSATTRSRPRCATQSMRQIWIITQQ